MSFITDLYFIRKLRKLELEQDEKVKKLRLMESRLRDIECDIFHQSSRENLLRPNLCEILKSDSDAIVNLKMTHFRQQNQIDFIKKEVNDIKGQIYDCKVGLGVKR